METNFARRRFVRQLALVSVGAAVGVSEPNASAAFTPIARVGGPHLLPAVNAYSFLELLNANLKDPTKGIDLFGVCDFAAKQNLFAVDLTGYFFPGYPKPPADG